jgi:predicted nuclease of predicted toxin-antitoxin system
VRLLVDANLSPRVAELLIAAGHDARHVVEVGLTHASDATILAAADDEGRVVVSSDTDFGALLARHDRASPSFVLIRHMNQLTPDEQACLLVTAIKSAGPSSRPARSSPSRAAEFASVGCRSVADVPPK